LADKSAKITLNYNIGGISPIGLFPQEYLLRAAEAEKRLKNFKALIRLKLRRSPDIMGVKKKKQIRCHCEPVRTLVWQSPRKTGNSVRNDS